jgi:hypothetical protein
MATSVFSEAYVRGRIVDWRDAGHTAAAVTGNELLFRCGIVSDVLTMVGVAVLVWALHVVLSPVQRSTAILATLLRVVETSVSSVAIAGSLVALRVFLGVAYLRDLEPSRAASLGQLFLSLQGTGFRIAFVFLGAGSAVFCHLWRKSGYIPRFMATWGLAASVLLSLGALAPVLFPALGRYGMATMLPLGIFEVGLGAWLLVKGLRPAPSTAGPSESGTPQPSPLSDRFEGNL